MFRIEDPHILKLICKKCKSLFILYIISSAIYKNIDIHINDNIVKVCKVHYNNIKTTIFGFIILPILLRLSTAVL